MKKMELEVKILDVNKEEFIKNILNMGAIKKEETKQYLYTYDLPSIYGRYIDIVTQLNNPESQIKYETSIEKLKLFAFEFDNMLSKNQSNDLYELVGYNNLCELCKQNGLLAYLNDEKLIAFMKQFHNNNKKWIRVRQTGNKTTIAVKHILANNNSNIQQMMETELEVSNIKEANNLLEALGFSYKSYQEKERITYILENYEIDIDTWPGIPTYIEIEGDSEQDLVKILKRLGYSLSDTVSCTADEIYLKYGKSMFDSRELKFDSNKICLKW